MSKRMLSSLTSAFLVIAIVAASRVDHHAHVPRRNPAESQWSEWSDWGPCSRTCDGGATYQTRQCLDTVRGCSGSSIRYQICNMQPCPELVDFRLQQCSSYNTIPYQGKLHVWVPHADSRSPCSLSCRSLNTSLIVQLSARVHDGTRCKPGSLDMCIDGLCQPVGCDLQLNSDLKIDECGVCGGDGSTCRDAGDVTDGKKFRWEYGHQLSACSASCDGGEQEVEIVCRDALTGLVASDVTLCEDDERPPVKLVPCNVDPCPPKWVVGAWGPCSVTCGGGVKERVVQCQQGQNNTQVDDVICSALIGARPRSHEPCNSHECPAWFEGPWSECSKSCGADGIQTRIVVCRDARGHVTNACRAQDQPESTRPCPAAPACPSTTAAPITTTAPNRPPRQKVTPFSLFDDDEEDDDTDEPKTNEQDKESELKGILIQRAGSNAFQPAALLSERLHVGEISLVPTDPTFIVGDWTPCSTTCGDGARTREVHCKIFLEFSKTVAKLPDKECPGPKPAETEACFIRPCSHSKYDGQQHQISDQSNYRRKPAEDLRMATKMELTSSPHHSLVSVTKPFASASAGAGAAPSGQSAHHAGYVWKSSGFSQCSASCLGGVQESIIECVREHDGQRVSPHHCPMDRRPDAITRTCNDVPCPPRWNTSDFSACSRPCGGGVQTREVHCIHEVARGGSNTLPVSSDLCPQPPPRAHQFCNMIDCPVEWKTGEWSQCSSTCDGGFKVRKVTCQQVLALGQVLTKTANQCNPTTRPAESKPCNSGTPCGTSNAGSLDYDLPDGGSTAEETDNERSILPDSEENTGIINLIDRSLESDNPKIQSSHHNFVQESANKKIVKLRVGGKATVYKGAQVSIRCPVKYYDKSKIGWMKDHILLVRSEKHDVNKKGTLRVREVTFSDSGVYSCIAGRSAANITLTVRPLPATPDSAETDAASPAESDNSRAPINELFHVSNGTWRSKDKHRLDENEDDELPGRPSNSVPDELPTGPLFSDQEQPATEARDETTPTPTVVAHHHRHAKGRKGKLRHAARQKPKIKNHAPVHTTDPTEVVLGKGKAENLKFEWLVTPWSKCSQTCGGSGFQVRAVQCLVRLNNVTKSVESTLCEDAGLPDPDGRAPGTYTKQPATVQKCGLDTCPKWKIGAWIPCHQSRCFTWNTALQKRAIDCVMDNGTVLDPILCSEKEKPIIKRECFNENCRGTWKVSEWSHCTATCGSLGHQSRLLRCVWHGTDSPAGLACTDLPRLPVTRPCRGPPCPKRGQCRDQSGYCALAETLDLCFVPRYQEHCCRTCKRANKKKELEAKKKTKKPKLKTAKPVKKRGNHTTTTTTSAPRH